MVGGNSAENEASSYLTFEPLLCGLGVTTGLVEVVAGTDRGDGTADLESSGHVCCCWRSWIVIIKSVSEGGSM